MTHFKIIIHTVMSLCLMANFPSIVQPYVLQGPHIIQLMTEKIGQANSLFVSQRVIFYNVEPQPETMDEEYRGGDANDTAIHMSDQPAGLDQTDLVPAEAEPIQMEESVRYVFSRAFRSDIISDTNQRIYITNRGQALTVIDGLVANFKESRFDLYKDLLLYRSRKSLSKRLADLGVDVTVSSLGKFDDRLALVIGAEFPDETAPQVWVDKETFHPLRLMIPAAHNSHTGYLEFRYADWQPIGKTWYPMQIEFIEDGTTVRAVEVSNYQINPQFSEDIFDITRLMSEYHQNLQIQSSSGNTEDISEVQKTIEKFKKIFE